MNEKRQLRKRLLSQRADFSVADLRSLSQTIFEKFIKNIDLDKVKIIHIYKTIHSKKEVDTGPIIKYILKSRPEINMYFPGPTPEENLICDLVIVPVLGFDENCNRLGFGGGYYDRFLAKRPPKLTVGLAYSFSEIFGDFPRANHDKQLDIIITDKGIIRR